MKLLRWLIPLLLIASPAVAQWQAPNHAVPIGRGVGIVGFKSAAPGTAGYAFTSQGAGADPAFGGDLKVNLNASVLPTPFTGTVIQAGNADAVSTKLDLRSWGTAAVPGLVTYKTRGTNASPTAVQSGDTLSSWLAGGYGASAYSSLGGIIQINACENWTNAAQCTEFEFFNNPTGAITPISVGKIKQGWIIGAATGADQGIGTANLAGSLFFNGTDWGSFTKTLTNKTFNCANNTCTVRIGSDVTGLGTGVATALAVNVGSAGAPVTFNGAGGTPSSLTLTNATGLPTTGLTGTLQAAQEPAHTGDCTNSAGSLALTCTSINGVNQTTAWTTYTPTVTCAGGPPTTFSVTGSSSKTIGKTIAITISLAITTIGPCTAPLTFSLPVAPLVNGFLVGGENQSTGKVVKIPLNAGSTTSGGLTNYDNTFPAASSTTFILTGVYQSQ